jgi:Flp pilus assembly pilin Flp
VRWLWRALTPCAWDRPARAGQTNVEYALILLLVAVTAAVVLHFLGDQINAVLKSINAQL